MKTKETKSTKIGSAADGKSYFTPEVFQGKVFVGCQSGVYLLNKEKFSLEPFNEFDGMFQGDLDFGVHRIFNQDDKRLWFVWFLSDEKGTLKKFTGFISTKDGKYQVTRWPFPLIEQAGIMNDIFFESEKEI